MQNQLPPFAHVARDLDYNPENGHFQWIRGCHGRVLGTHAGSVREGRRVICLYGKAYPAARLAYLLMTGEDPGVKDIDHINGNALDNRWGNLRCVTRSQNLMNRRAYSQHHKETSTGFKGVYPRGNRYVALVRANGKLNYLGYFDEARQAGVRVAEYYRDAGLMPFQPKEVRELLRSAA